MHSLGLGLLVALWVQGAAAFAVPPVAVSVSLEARSLDLDLDQISVMATSEGLEEIIEPHSRNGHMVHFELPAYRSWSVTCRGERFWCPSIPIATKARKTASTRWRLPVARRVRVQAKLEAFRGELPETLKLQGWETKPPHGQPLEFELEAAIEGRHVDLQLPDIALDLRVAAAGFVPLYVWGLKPSSQPKTADGIHGLGRWTLGPGSSLCGFVTDGVTGDPVEGAEIQLRMPPRPPGTPVQTARRMERMTWQTKSNGRGFFQMVGPPAGVYQLKVTPAEVGRLPRILPTVELAEQSETCLDTLELHAAIPFRLLLDNPSGVVGDSPWQIRLDPNSAEGHVLPQGIQVPDDEGAVLFRVAPGDYDLTIFSTYPPMRVLSRDVTIQAERALHIELDILPVEGQILLGETPLVAEIDLAVNDGGFSRLESNGDGRFRGWTKRPQNGLVIHVKAVHPEFSRFVQLDEIDIEDGVLRLELEFPDRRITGTVQDESGRPVRSAKVTARPVSSNLIVTTKSGVDGRFELVGLEETPQILKASARDLGDSEWLRVEPGGPEDTPDLSLVLERGRKLEGRVLTDLGEPVAAGRVQLLAVGDRSSSVHDTTNVSGHFEVRVAETETRAVVQVFSSRLNWSACLTLPPVGQPIEIRLPSAFGGSVYLPYEEAEKTIAQSILFNSDGGFFTLSELLNFGDLHEVEGGYLASNIAPGVYAVLTSPGRVPGLALRACDRSLPTERWQPLANGQELRFDLDR